MSTAAGKKPAKKPYDRPENSKGKGKADEDAGKIRRPQNSWILYRKDKFELLRKEAEAENKPRPIAADASRIISEAWKNESPHVKKYYNDLAEKEKARHAEEHPDYKFQPKTKAQRLQERQAKELAKERKDDDLRNEREAKLAARSGRGVGSDKKRPPIPPGIPLYYPPFAMGPPPLPGQPPSCSPSTTQPMSWFPFSYPAYLPTPAITPPSAKASSVSNPVAEVTATASGSGSGPGHQTPGEAKAAKVMAKAKKRRSVESNATTSSPSGASAPTDSRATVASSPPIATPPTIQQEVGVPKSTPIRGSSSSSNHSETVSLYFHGYSDLRLTCVSVQEVAQLPRPSSRSKSQLSPRPAPASTSPLSFDLNLLGIPLAVPPSSSASPIRPTSDTRKLFVDPKALTLAQSSSALIFEPSALQASLPRPQHDFSPILARPGADPVLQSHSTSQDITSFDSLDIPYPTSREAFELAGFNELNFYPGAGEYNLDEVFKKMFDLPRILDDSELKEWGGGWEGVDNTGAARLDLGIGEFELGEGVGADDGLGFGFDDTGIDSAVGFSLEADAAVHAAAHVGVPAVLPTPHDLVAGQVTFAGSGPGSSGPTGSSGNGPDSDELSFTDLSTFLTTGYASYPQQLQPFQSHTEAQSIWEVPTEDSSFSLSDYVDYTMCRTPSVANLSRGGSAGPSRPLSRAASASASGAGRGRSLSRSSVPPGTTPSRGRSVASTRGRSATRSVAGGSSRGSSRVSRADSRESVSRRIRDVRVNSFAGIPAGPTKRRGRSGGLEIGLDLSEMHAGPPPPTLPPPSAIIGVSSTAPQPVPSQVSGSVEVIGGMDSNMLATYGGMLPGSSGALPTVQPNQCDLIAPPPAPIPPSITKMPPQAMHIQSMPPPGIPTVSSEDLAGMAGQSAIAWDPNHPPPAGYLLVAVPIQNSVGPSATSSNLTPGTTSGTVGTVHISSNDAIPGVTLPPSGLETWNVDSVDYSGGSIRPSDLEQHQHVQSRAEEVQGSWIGFGT
jgi:hypothetical protein